MKGLLLVRLKIEGLYPEGVLVKLRKEEIPVSDIKKTDKKTLELCIERKYRKKVFTILRNSCYNIIGTEYFGFARALAWCKQKTGVFIGVVLFALLCCLSDIPVLRIEVVGTGDYYRREVLSVLGENGIAIGRTYSNKNTAEVTARILAFENVSFCSLKKNGSVLRVEVQTSSSALPCEKGKTLLSPASGQVYALTVVRGTAKVSEGDAVEKGQELVGAAEGREEIIMASVRILCRYAALVSADSAENAVASCVLEIESAGSTEITECDVTPQADGFFVEISYLVTESLNM